MNLIPQPTIGQTALIVDPRAALPQMMALTAAAGLQGPVQIVAGGNRFEAFQLAREVRRHTTNLQAVLERIQIARAFTCYQVVALLAETPATPAPLLVLDLLTTFHDESVALVESERLLHLVVRHLERLRQLAPIVISVRSPSAESQPRPTLLPILAAAADIVHAQEAAEPPQLPRLL